MNMNVFEITGKRVGAFRAAMEEKKVDAAVVCSGPGVRYLSGFAGTPGDASLLITQNDAYIFTDSRYTIQAAEQCPYFTLKSHPASDFHAMKEFLPAPGASVGFENLSISYAGYNKLKAGLGTDSPVGLDHAIDDLRNIKDDEEAACIRKACDIACDALAETVPYIKDGVTELEVANELEYRMKKNGASSTSFDTIVASGVRGALPHGLASEKIIRGGEFVTIDFGCVYNGYCSDMTRTFSLGDADPELVKIYYTVLEAQLTAIDAYVPGMTGVALDKIARDIIAEAGYGQYFGHGLGHGVGLEIHEGVSVSSRSTSVLPERSVFSIEPGIYIEGLGGVRIEDLIMCRGGEKTVLTAKSPKAFTVL